MTQEETLDYNIRCAKFLGVDVDYSTEVYKDSKSPLRDHIHNKPKSEPLLFDEDWNWIMRVIEAIEKLYDHPNKEIKIDVTPRQIEVFQTPYRLEDDDYREVIYLGNGYVNGSKKEAIVQAINQFLIWHEQNK